MCFAGVLLLIHAIFAGTTGVLYYYDFDVFPVDFSNVPLNLLNDDTYLHQMAWNNRDSALNQNLNDDDSPSPRQRSWLGYYTEVTFVPPEGQNVFSPEYLSLMHEFEKSFALMSYHDSFCFRANPQTPCLRPKSILRYFDNQENNNVTSGMFENVTEVLVSAKGIDPGRLDYFLGKNSIVEADENVVFSDVTRSLFFLRHNDSAPVEFETFLVTDLHDWLWQHHLHPGSNMQIYFNNAILFFQV